MECVVVKIWKFMTFFDYFGKIYYHVPHHVTCMAHAMDPFKVTPIPHMLEWVVEKGVTSGSRNKKGNRVFLDQVATSSHLEKRKNKITFLLGATQSPPGLGIPIINFSWSCDPTDHGGLRINHGNAFCIVKYESIDLPGIPVHIQCMCTFPCTFSRP